MANFDPTRLIQQLQNTGLAVKDNPLFQLLFQMLKAMATLNNEVNSFTGGGGGGTSNIVNNLIYQLSLDGDSGSGGGDGGDVIPGPAGADGANGMVPYFIALGETFTVPEFKQALFSMNIDNEGTLDVEGFLIEVD